jgi:hypothetical protein
VAASIREDSTAKLHTVPEINFNMLDAEFLRHCAKELQDE